MRSHNTILYIANSNTIGGGNRSLLTILKQLKQTEFSSAVFVPGDGELCGELRSLGVRFYVMPLMNPEDSKIKLFLRLAKYVLKCRQLSPCLIHANSLFCYRLAGLSAKSLKIPIICHMRYSIDADAIMYWLRPRPNTLIFNSAYMMDQFEAKNPLFPKNIKRRVIYNGFDPKEYYLPQERNIVRARLGIDKDNFLIGIIGNFAKVKGHETFLKMAQSLNKNSKMFFIVAGDDILENGQRKTFLKEMVNSLGLIERVKFLGFVDKIGELLSGLDALVVPSIFEPFGRVAVEGLLAGVPVVASRVGGLIEILEGNPLGKLVEPNDIMGFAKALEQIFLARARNQYKEWISQGQFLAEQQFGVTKNFNRLVQVYRDLHLERRSPSW